MSSSVPRSSWIIATPGLWVLLLFSLSADAAEPVLTARPGVCILQSAKDAQCAMAVDLNWNDNGSANYCLYSSLVPEPLKCWQSVNQGSFHSELASRKDVAYWLERPGEEKVLAKITIRIVSVSARNPQRRRRRHVWNVL